MPFLVARRWRYKNQFCFLVAMLWPDTSNEMLLKSLGCMSIWQRAQSKLLEGWKLFLEKPVGWWSDLLSVPISDLYISCIASWYQRRASYWYRGDHFCTWHPVPSNSALPCLPKLFPKPVWVKMSEVSFQLPPLFTIMHQLPVFIHNWGLARASTSAFWKEVNSPCNTLFE